MRTDLDEKPRNDLRRVLGEMESLAPLAPELERSSLRLTTTRQSRPHPLLVALGAAIAVFALALPVTLLSTAPSIDEIGESTPLSTVTASSLLETTPAGDWSVDEIPVGAVLAAVGQGFVAVVNEVRISENGLDWHTSGSLDEGAVASDIAYNEGVLVVAGTTIRDVTDADGELQERTHTPGLWASSDQGSTWTRFNLVVSDVTETPDGFAAVGVEMDNSDAAHNKTQGVLWTSTDGVSWTEVARSDDPEGISSNFRNLVWDDQLVILGHRGPHYVSEGSGLEDPEPHDNVTWFSDGTNLSDPSPSTLTGNLDADSTTVTPHGIIATTHWSTPTVKTEAAAWISQDGTDWTKLDIEPGSYEYTDVAHIGEEVFISGYAILDTESDGVDTGLWSSHDGITWTRMDLPEMAEWTRLHQVAVSDTALVITGDDQRSGVLAGRLRS